MREKFPLLLIEINIEEIIFAVCKYENENFKLLHKQSSLTEGIKNNRIENFELIYNIFRSNIYSLEQKINHTFKEAILILNNFNCSITNISGFKKLNGSQLERGNITYILNSLKSEINETENEKKILHIFNSNYLLDKKKIENLPIGLFGNFYSQELSFYLIDKNDFKNLNNIFNKCNLRLKKIISKKFIEGTHLINEDSNLDCFFKVEINRLDSKIIFFENSALKFYQDFRFGSDIIINDISKITKLELDVVREVLKDTNFLSEHPDKSFLKEDFFSKQNFRKIKKKLILDVAKSRIEEIAEIIILKNINVQNFLSKNCIAFIQIDDEVVSKMFRDNFKSVFSRNDKLVSKIFNKIGYEKIYENTLRLVQFGWKREAVPVVQEKKSLLARLFGIIFK